MPTNNIEQRLTTYRENPGLAEEFLTATLKDCNGIELRGILKKYNLTYNDIVCEHCYFRDRNCGSENIKRRREEIPNILAMLTPREVKEI